MILTIYKERSPVLNFSYKPLIFIRIIVVVEQLMDLGWLDSGRKMKKGTTDVVPFFILRGLGCNASAEIS
jgi:hypothetical protein